MSITASENDEIVEVCAILVYDTSHNISINFTVPVTPKPDTAGNGHCDCNVPYRQKDHSFTSDFEDFSNETKQLVFNSSCACVEIAITDDKSVEQDTGFFREKFSVTLENEEDNRVIIDPYRKTSLVYILDDDSMHAFHIHKLKHVFLSPHIHNISLFLLDV